MKNRIKELRTKLNITQDELAQSVSVRRETIVFLEQGKYNPSLNLAHSVAKKLGVKIDDLFIFEDEKSKK
ncbi:MAG: helix-turn-helix transcriptional regulator [Candidatus Paceibacterota bacterium]|jgi:putative transcriptional regulator|nr:helix-turn-helix transcriptional regulator [bacterium]